MDLKKSFPEMQESQFPIADDFWISIEKDEHYLNFPKNSLTDREVELLQMMVQESPSAEKVSSPWYRYLVKQVGSAPQELAHVQFLYLNHQEALSAAFLQVLEEILSEAIAIFPVSQNRTVLFLEISDPLDSLTILQDIQPTLESDFGLALSLFVGNEWHHLDSASLRDVFEEENALFSAYLLQKGGSKVQNFSQLMLWAFLKDQKSPAIEGQFQRVLMQNSDFSALIESMWESQGNLVQTAQKLYIHRNSLQYKLDKLKKLTGLNLKVLDDLAFAYLFLQKS
ncbi:PucR family transcriptional regulator [Streptococcus uberis]|uniref:PucR family transcriptional regulator n=1 Tax=Streptococcus uberis TaxID=1349 RepID=UPI001FF10CF7|nr:helix-turn-helix domain-containing protein [Streptococcus uberis]MCK1213549.1 helix-turn-helix domain-containing protein [Streptococcus uberis]